MTLVKTSILTILSTAIKVISAFLINKVVSLYVGPSGLALIGQFQNFSNIITTFSNGAIASGIVKYTAEYQTIEKKQRIFSSSLILSIFYSSVMSIILIVFNEYWSQIILKDVQYKNVFVVFGATIFLYSLNIVLISILNGQKEIKKYIIVNIAGSIVSLFFTIALIVKLNIIGALYALVTNQSVVFFITIFFVIKSNWFKISCFLQGIDKDSFYKLSKYSLMSITTAVTVPVSHLAIRDYIVENIGWEHAGYWQGVWYISTIYLMLVTTALSVYYLPRLSEIDTNTELRKEIAYGYKIIMPIVIVSSIVVFILKEYLVLIAFNQQFMPMLELFKWQLIGNVIKIASWLLGFITVAKAMVKTFIALEILGSLVFVVLSICFMDMFGLVGVTYAYALNYSLYMFVMIYIFMKKFM